MPKRFKTGTRKEVIANAACITLQSEKVLLEDYERLSEEEPENLSFSEAVKQMKLAIADYERLCKT